LSAQVQSEAKPHDSTREVVANGAVIRFAGDSGDGVQLTGQRFTSAVVLAGNDVATLPDFPSEIRAPAGTLYGVSGFQLQFASKDVFTPGDSLDVLVALNAAALRTNLPDLKTGGLLVIDTGALGPAQLKKAGYATNPLEDGSLSDYQVVAIDISTLTRKSVMAVGLSTKEAGRCKNLWTLGLILSVYGRSLDSTLSFIVEQFKKRPEYVEANSIALKAGYAYASASELFHQRYRIAAAPRAPGLYRNIDGNTALSFGLIAGSICAERHLVLGAYPITPASGILQELSKHRHLGVTAIQAEDEIAAACLAVGAAYAGAVGACCTSGPGMALKTEAIGLAVATELPMIIVDVQRAGPSTGMPTKPEQSDLFLAVHGRNGEAPVCVLAPATPSECFQVAYDAVRIAIRHMTPVIVLSDAYLANGAEPWLIPNIDELARLERPPLPPCEQFSPMRRDDVTLARPWAAAGTPGYEHRVGGLEKDYESGQISTEPLNHERMVRMRAEKVARIAEDLPESRIDVGETQGRLLVIGWGSTYGSIREAVEYAIAKGAAVSQLQLRSLCPFPRGLGHLMSRFEKILVAELNAGQLAQLLRAHFLHDIQSFTKIQGKPFRTDELTQRILLELEGDS
jgi:2-oxoglutarate/2-oxoacid ferredoxin oxidoreductase subunit alpha